MTTEYTPTSALAAQLVVHARQVEMVAQAMVERSNRLTYQGPGGYADVHLDEDLATFAERLGQLQHAVEGMREYTREAVDKANRAA